MGSITVIEIIKNAQTITQDLKNVFWLGQETVDYFNAAQREVVTQRPDAYSELGTHVCTGSVTQQIPANGLRFLDATHNVATGYVISPMERSKLDEVQRNWQQETTQADEVEHYVFDPRFPRQFKLYPCPKPGTEIGIGFSRCPAQVTIALDGNGKLDEADPTTISLDDIYANCIMDYMLARMYQKSTKLSQSEAKSQRHFALFYQALGVKYQADMAASPNHPNNKAD